MRQDIVLVTRNDRLTSDFKAITRSSKNIRLKTLDTPTRLNRVFKKKGAILEVMIIDLTLPSEDLNRFIFYIRQYKKDLPIVLLQADRRLNKKESEASRNLSIYGCIRRPSNREETEDFLDDLNNILDLDMDKKLSKVEFLEKERVFACTFKNMRVYFLPRKNIPVQTGDDNSKVLNCVIDKDGYHFTVFLESGKRYIIPWDFILHRCEEKYEYYFKKQQDEGISQEEIGKRVRQERKRRNLTQKQLAQKTDILRPNIARIESGKHYPSLETLEKIAEALNIPVARLLVK